MGKWVVYLENENTGDEDEIDCVYGYDGMTEDEVRLSLINHDGYDPRIEVVKDIGQ